MLGPLEVKEMCIFMLFHNVESSHAKNTIYGKYYGHTYSATNPSLHYCLKCGVQYTPSRITIDSLEQIVASLDHLRKIKFKPQILLLHSREDLLLMILRPHEFNNNI